MNRCVRFALLSVAAALAVFGQQKVTGVIAGGAISMAPAITGAPYSADEVNENVQTLADGTHITHTSTLKLYRDAQGRTRREAAMAGAEGGMAVTIDDPVAQVRSTLNTSDKVVYMRALAEIPNRHTLQRAPAPRRTRTTENLGTQTMDGVEVQGTRYLDTWPVGAISNDRPITSVGEVWRSVELNIVVLEKVSDPLHGDTTRKLTILSRKEPDPGLFQPPPDYTVVDESQPR